jgi:hypothetical protein
MSKRKVENDLEVGVLSNWKFGVTINRHRENCRSRRLKRQDQEFGFDMSSL